MSPRPVHQRYTAVFCAFMMMAVPTLFPGCQPPPTDTSSGTNQPIPLLPGAVLTIKDAAILAGKSASIEFVGPGGAHVFFEARNTQDGVVTVPVPPLFDPQTGESVPGDLFYRVVGSDTWATVAMDQLPSAEGTSPGSVMRIVLDAAVQEYQHTLDNLALINADLGADAPPSPAVAEVTTQIDTLQKMIANYDTTGRFVLPESAGSGYEMSLEQMTLSDRWLAAILQGVGDQATLEAGIAGKAILPLAKGGPTRPRIDQMARQGIANIKQAIQVGCAGASTLAATVGLVGTVAVGIGLVAEAPIVVLIGGFCAVGGAIASFTSGAMGGANSDSYLNRDPTKFNTGQEALSQAVRYGTNAVSVIPGPVGQATQAVGAGLSLYDAANNARAIRCVGAQPKHQRMAALDDFCRGVDPPANTPVSNSGPISPPECPAPAGSPFVSRTDADGRYYEYFTSPYNPDIQVGLFREWYSAGGQLARQGCHNDQGEIHGLCRAWRPDGTLDYESNYLNGILDGWTRTYYPSGHILREVTFVPYGGISLPDGVDRWYFDETGQLREETVYVGGVRNGSVRSWYSNGQLEIDGGYANDKVDGPWVWYNLDGTVASECTYSGETQSCK